MTEMTQVRCGNHSVRVYHASAQEVRNCYATHIGAAQLTQVRETPADPPVGLPAWMTDEDPNYVRPLPNEGRKVRGWWDLPIAESMWTADAVDLQS